VLACAACPVTAFSPVSLRSCRSHQETASRADAPVVVDPAAIIALAGEPWRDRQSFVEALEAGAGGLDLDMPRLPEAVRGEDPFLWSVMGRFGAAVPGVRSSGGIVTCSRYGLATRDRLAERNLSDPAVFAIFGATQAAPDDAEVWPETGGRAAGLRDDVERHAAGGDPARGARRAALAARFERVIRRGDREVLGEDWRDRPAVFGPGGYQLIGERGPRDTVVELESARIELRVAHQQIRFRRSCSMAGCRA
jgi:hypothetical protein